MSADLLRRAASLMRERARSATESPWSAPDVFGVIRAEYGSGDDGTLVHGDSCGCGGGISTDTDAEHIASWHPVVALAVADWLDAEAEHIQVTAEKALSINTLLRLADNAQEIAARISLGYETYTQALAAARAYLGESS